MEHFTPRLQCQGQDSGIVSSHQEKHTMRQPNPNQTLEGSSPRRPPWRSLLMLALVLTLPAEGARVVVSHRIDIGPLLGNAVAARAGFWVASASLGDEGHTGRDTPP